MEVKKGWGWVGSSNENWLRKEVSSRIREEIESAGIEIVLEEFPRLVAAREKEKRRIK